MSATDEQKAVLGSDARICVVRAVPGSGKTWLVAELIRHELEKWKNRTCGIAALSFTRVGGDEIRRAVGRDLDHPHFVGTIDAFLFRYVIRPFLCHWLNKFPSQPRIRSPRLIPEETGIEHWRQYGSGGSQKTTINLYGLVWVDEDDERKPNAEFKPHPLQPLRPLPLNIKSKVIRDKKNVWEKRGHLTHSDAAMWACYLLRSNTTIRSEIIRRFPLIIVDELQDTGYFLGKCIQSLLSEDKAHGVLVGDPDQAIFTFTGAKPELFTQFESIKDAYPFPLSDSRRCPQPVTTIASYFKESPGEIGWAANKNGRTFLLRYSEPQMVTDVNRVTKKIREESPGITVKVIVRRNSTVKIFSKSNTKDAPKLGCPSIAYLHKAVVMFRQGIQAKAFNLANKAVVQAIFKDTDEEVNDDFLKGYGIDPFRWKRLVTDCLLRANGEPAIGTFYEWQSHLGKIFDEELLKFGFDESLQFVSGKLKPKKLIDWSNACADYLPQNSETLEFINVPVATVHAVKGETHDTTIFVCPDTSPPKCPSVVWWADGEEKRIAYVAMTRTQGDLILCVSDACYQRLASNRPQFVASFEKNMTVDEYITNV